LGNVGGDVLGAVIKKSFGSAVKKYKKFKNDKETKDPKGPDNPLAFKSTSDAGEIYDPAKFKKVQTALEKQGVTFVTGDEGKRLANSLSGEALYWPAEPGKAGIMVFGPNPTRAQVIEEVLHFGQHKKSGYGEIGDKIVDLEIQAQDKLLNLGARKNWSAGEIEQIQRAREQWLQMKNKSGR